MEKTTVRRIKKAVVNGNLPAIFKGKDVNHALNINWGGNFLAKHRVGNPGGETEHFIQVSRGQYRLN